MLRIADLSEFDLMVIQIDGLRAAARVSAPPIGIEAPGEKHVLAVALGAMVNAAVVKALPADPGGHSSRADIARDAERRVAAPSARIA